MGEYRKVSCQSENIDDLCSCRGREPRITRAHERMGKADANFLADQAPCLAPYLQRALSHARHHVKFRPERVSSASGLCGFDLLFLHGFHTSRHQHAFTFNEAQACARFAYVSCNHSTQILLHYTTAARSRHPASTTSNWMPTEATRCASSKRQNTEAADQAEEERDEAEIGESPSVILIGRRLGPLRPEQADSGAGEPGERAAGRRRLRSLSGACIMVVTPAPAFDAA